MSLLPDDGLFRDPPDHAGSPRSDARADVRDGTAAGRHTSAVYPALARHATHAGRDGAPRAPLHGGHRPADPHRAEGDLAAEIAQLRAENESLRSRLQATHATDAINATNATNATNAKDTRQSPATNADAGADTGTAADVDAGAGMAHRSQDEFLATLAHELRNPLAPIRHALETIRLSADHDVRQHARDVIERQMRQLVHLVDDLLDISRISRGKLELRRERTDLSTVLQEAIETSRPLIDASLLRLVVRKPAAGALPVVGDSTRLCQVLANLLNNAAKYTPAGGRIEVEARREGDEGVVVVSDTGAGLPPEMLPHVFDMFAQVDRRLARAQGGLGIGLAMARRLVGMHGGTVTVHSDGPGLGCVFTVRVPLSPDVPPVTRESARPGIATSADDAMRVMVVDDNVDSADSLAQLLTLLGYQTAIAHDGLAAVERAAEFRPRVALLDIGLPGISGHEAARRIRALPGGAGMLLVAVSGWGQESDRQRSRDAGFDHHFVKPLDLDGLLALLEPLNAGH